MAQGASTPAIVCIGPSGAGKSTLGRALAARLGWRFIEGDDHHPPGNLAKLHAGVPLGETDRAPFLDSIARAIAAADGPVIASCSALRRANRERLREQVPDVLFVWIDVGAHELERRVKDRREHFMAPSLLPNQLATFEPPRPPERFLRVEGKLPVAAQVKAVLSHIDGRR